MPAERRQHRTGITKKALTQQIKVVHRRNTLIAQANANPVPDLLLEFEKRTKEIEKLERKLKEEKAMRDMAFKKLKLFGIDGYRGIKVEEEEGDDELEDYISSREPTPPQQPPRPPTPPRRSTRLQIKTRPFDNLVDSIQYPLPPPLPQRQQPVAGPSRLPPFDPRIVNHMPWCEGCQRYGHHILYCPDAELQYPPEE